MTYKDMTFCAAKCLNETCHRNRIHTVGAKDLPVCWTDYSLECEEYEPVDHEDLATQNIQYLMAQANVADGLSWELGEAFHELSFHVADRLDELRNEPHLTPKAKRGFEKLIRRLKLDKNRLPW